MIRAPKSQFEPITLHSLQCNRASWYNWWKGHEKISVQNRFIRRLSTQQQQQWLFLGPYWSWHIAQCAPFFLRQSWQYVPKDQGWIFCHVTLKVLAFSTKLNFWNRSTNKKVKRSLCRDNAPSLLDNAHQSCQNIHSWLVRYLNPFFLFMWPRKVNSDDHVWWDKSSSQLRCSLLMHWH